MFAHPLTSFWTHLEASNCHIVQNPKNRRFLPEISKSRIFPYFLYRGAIGVGTMVRIVCTTATFSLNIHGAQLGITYCGFEG